MHTLRSFHINRLLLSPLPQQRDRSDIIKGILEIVHDTQPLYRNQMNQTRLGYEAGLTHPQTVKYLKMLVGHGLLVLTSFKPVPFYEITDKGRSCLKLFDEIEDDLRPVRNTAYQQSET